MSNRSLGITQKSSMQMTLIIFILSICCIAFHFFNPIVLEDVSFTKIALPDSDLRISNINYKNVSVLVIPQPKDYLWNNNKQYNLLCKRIQSRFRNSTTYLTFKYSPFGFGNLYYSVVTIVALSLASNYRLFYDYQDYNIFFDSCFSINILERNEFIDYGLQCIDYRSCFKGLAAFGKHNMGTNLFDLMPRTNILIGGSLMEIEKVYKVNKHKDVWKNLFKGINGGWGIWNVRRMFLHLLLNPEPVLKRKYLEEREKLLVHKYTIGLQLRMGGSLADVNEEYTGVPFNRIDEVIDQVRNLIKKKKWENNFQLFISSDSSYVIDVIRNKTLGEFPVVSSHLFKRGHTELESGKDITRSVLVDMYYMSMADHIYVTWPSSLGRLMCFMVEERNCGAVLNWWQKSKNIDFV